MDEESDERISVLIVEDAPIYREALEGNLRAQASIFNVVGWADQRETTISMVEQYVPDIVLLDLVLFRDRTVGIEIIRDIQRISPSTQIVVLTAHLDEDLIFQAIWAGASTYLLKDKVSGAQLADILMMVQAGEPPMEAEIARRLCHFFQLPHDEADPEINKVQLTNREREVLELVAAGLKNREIAEALVITEKTVKTHISNTLGKLHLSNRTELKMWYQRQQINEPGKPKGTQP